jgi:hypothetical protein
MVGLLMNDKLERALNGAIVAYFKVPSQRSPEGATENQ